MTEATKPVGERSLREQAYDSFTTRLLSREIRPGQFVSQRELATITGMPLGAIREMVPRLEADGLISTVPQRGMQIAHIDLKLVRNAFQLRLFLEAEAAALFAIKAPDDLLAQMRARHEDVLARARQGITPDLLEHAQVVDWSLHDSIIDALDNEIISNVYRVNSLKIRLIRQERFRLNENLLTTVMQDHLAIISAFEQRDPDLAVKNLQRHLENARGRALGLGEM
ncbi:GntR family transcriptional regulator [Thalassospira sp.]|uniref:GntR family transcriptional regulator n=1 Tax=Thalassospira sp. TaxID=1912094 RepID=UPI00273701B6|nr:GntR family transcriptional regulator [Thalassospira sp.]MDP2699411.1 GntR family transcriptional regulator [Thalassospira sp.]